MGLIIDVSSWNPGVDYRAVRKAGVVGVIAKATESVSYVNPLYRRQLDDARKAGLYTGSYHFARPDKSGARSEALHFCATVKKLEALDLKPALDFETHSALSNNALEAWIREFNGCVFDRLGRWPFFYSYTSFINGLRLPKPVGNGLWLADYGPNDGKWHPVPAPAPWRKIQLHQYTSRGRVAGFMGDVSLFKGSVSPLLAFPVKARVAKYL